MSIVSWSKGVGHKAMSHAAFTSTHSKKTPAAQIYKAIRLHGER